MQANLGSVDQKIRFVVGICLLPLFFIIEGNLKFISLVGIVLILTASIKWCPAYLPFGLNTLGKKKLPKQD